MEVYRNRKDGFKVIQKRTLKIILPFMVLGLLSGIGISYYNNASFDTIPFVLVISFVAVSFGMYRGLNRQRILFNSYSLTVEDQCLIREQQNTPTVQIPKQDIQEIIRYPSGSYLIKGKNLTDLIIVSELVHDHDKLSATLSEMGEVKNQEARSILQRLMLPLIVGGLILMATVYVSTNKYLVLIAGTILVSGLAWSVYQVQTSKNVDRKTKRSIWWSVVVILSILGTMYAKLNG
ncbi:hypothetical protein [Pontibacter sp. H249]|uniref:hypothetical protein n=1 Tax=Pontibacter sp. H249 TaxID=3133420 RepID=UPI0030C4BD5D